MSISSYLSFTGKENVKDSDLTSRNIEALSNGEGPTMMGCKSARRSTCYVFDGGGTLVDKQRNQYPGN